MKVAIVNPTGGGMSGGYRAYLRNVLPRFAAHPAIEAVLCATPASVEPDKLLPVLPKVSFVPCAPFRFLCHNPDVALSQAVARFAPDVMFIPVERYLRFDGIPLIVMLQNMGPLVPISGNPLSERLRYIAQRHEAKIAIRNTARVIVPTIFVRNFLTKKWNIPEERVQVISYGSNLPNEMMQPNKPVDIPDEWSGKFIFTFGSIEPYRGLEDILGAIKQMSLNGEVPGLVIAGTARQNMRGYQRTLLQWIDRQKLTSRIKFTGALTEQEASWCYQNCRIFAMTSRVESFGIIGLEALAHGCVCIAASNPPLPEIFGQAARYYVPGDGKGLAHAIESVLALNGIQIQATSTRAKKQAALFSWDSTAEKTLAVLTEARQRR